MRKTVITGAIALIIGSLALPLSASAAAQDKFENDVVSITFADLNIESNAGAKALYARLKQASKAVCGEDSYREAGSLSRLAESKECFTNTLDEAVTAIDSDALKAIHSS
jgi:UrcA family protein